MAKTTVYSAQELRARLGKRFVGKMLDEMPGETYMTVRHVLLGNCDNMATIQKIMEGAEAALAKQEELISANRKMKSGIRTYNVAQS